MTGVLFNRNTFDKCGNVDDKIKYIEMILYQSRQVRHDLDYLGVTGPIYIRGGPNANQTEKVSELTDYIHKELVQLKRACQDTERLEESVAPPEDDAEGKQDHDLRMQNIKKVRADVEEANTNTFKILTEIVEKNKAHSYVFRI